MAAEAVEAMEEIVAKVAEATVPLEAATRRLGDHFILFHDLNYILTLISSASRAEV